ncbi:MAG: cupin domain-containing protein, partial [Haliea sp.]
MSATHDPAKQGDLIVNLKDAPFVELGAGTRIKLLRFSEETGDWVIWVCMEPGATIAPHWHLGH